MEAPWLSDLGANCVVVGQGVLLCADVATLSLYTLDLHLESQMTQITLQVPARSLLSLDIIFGNGINKIWKFC